MSHGPYSLLADQQLLVCQPELPFALCVLVDVCFLATALVSRVGVCGVSLSLGMAMVGLFVGCLIVRRLPAAWNGRM